VLLPLGVIVQFLEVGQVFSQVSDSVVCVSKMLYFSVQGFVPFLLDGEVDHGGECFSGEEGVSLLACEDSAGVQIFSCPEWA
jgi:hypothetical protein